MVNENCYPAVHEPPSTAVFIHWTLRICGSAANNLRYSPVLKIPLNPKNFNPKNFMCPAPGLVLLRSWSFYFCQDIVNRSTEYSLLIPRIYCCHKLLTHLLIQELIKFPINRDRIKQWINSRTETLYSMAPPQIRAVPVSVFLTAKSLPQSQLVVAVPAEMTNRWLDSKSHFSAQMNRTLAVH